MPSKVNPFIREPIYEEKLESHSSNDEQIIDVPSDYNEPHSV